MTEQPIRIVSTSAHNIVISGRFPSYAPDLLFNFWVEPEQLQKWWPPQASVDPRVGGSYDFFWPKQNWHLRGRYSVFEPGKALAFSWHWDHEPDRPNRLVEVSFSVPGEGGSKLKLTQSGYDGSEAELKEQEGHIEGWMHFLNQLYNLEIPD